MKYPIVLIGMPGSGKSTLGKILAKKLKVGFADFDTLLEEQEGASIPSIFAAKGEAYFRQQESELLKSVLKKAPEMVLATGGGAPCFFDNMEQIKRYAQSVYLQLEWPLLAQRLAQQPGQRPLLNGVEPDKFIDSLIERFGWRMPFYEQADIILTIVEGQTADFLARQLLSKLKE